MGWLRITGASTSGYAPIGTNPGLKNSISVHSNEIASMTTVFAAMNAAAVTSAANASPNSTGTARKPIAASGPRWKRKPSTTPAATTTTVVTVMRTASATNLDASAEARWTGSTHSRAGSPASHSRPSVTAPASEPSSALITTTIGTVPYSASCPANAETCRPSTASSMSNSSTG